MELMLIQTKKWVMQPKVWRFVGFASAVIGLLCYALSSSFNYLFGDWNLLKIFLYSVFSVIISLMILFAKMWQHSKSLRFKALAAFLVLTITSLYSFFFDKVMNGKPDAFSVISCAAFSIMLLSLSRQTQCGFEVDLLYFFLGCLIVQLMKIKLQLFFLGAGFSYLIIILRSSLSSIDVVIDNEHEHPPISPQVENLVVIEVHPHSPQLDSTEIGSIMMEQLSNYVKALQQENSNIIEMLLEQLKEYLSDDPELTVSDPNFVGVLRPKENSNLMIDALPPEIIDNLHKTAKLMISTGLEKDFSGLYIRCRREYLEESFSRLGMQQLGVEEVQKVSWQDFRDNIERWIKASNVAFKILFPTERRLCDRVFFGFSCVADLSFMDICREPTLQLLNFADTIALGNRSPERLFRVLDVFETMRDLIPETESLFCGSLQNEATIILKRLGEAIRGIFTELENGIRQHPAPGVAASPGGGIHHITRYVMNYLRVACEARQTLEQVFEEDYGHSLQEYPNIEDRVHSSLSVKMEYIMEILESNLEVKSKIYKEPALRHLFLMNNGMYVVQKTKDSEFGNILGDVAIQKYTAKARQHFENYQRSSWNNVLDFLNCERNGSMQPNDVAKSMKEKLKSFNMLFQEICMVQSSWFVFDEQLKEEIRISIEKLLFPAYGKFIERFQSVPELGKKADKYIKYGTEDIKVRLNDLFQGS